jgi:hypothetical protein
MKGKLSYSSVAAGIFTLMIFTMFAAYSVVQLAKVITDNNFKVELEV